MNNIMNFLLENKYSEYKEYNALFEFYIQYVSNKNFTYEKYGTILYLLSQCIPYKKVKPTLKIRNESKKLYKLLIEYGSKKNDSSNEIKDIYKKTLVLLEKYILNINKDFEFLKNCEK